ncbi:monocarboxylate permease-like protein [Lipomyces kononenkoae]
MADTHLENGHDGLSNAQAEEKPQAPLLEPPEGGTKAYLSLLGGSLGLFISFGWANCIGLFQAEYESNQLSNYSSSAVSWITSTEFFFMLFMSPLSGYLFDSYGPRLPIFIGGLMHVFGLMMTSLSSQYYQFMLSQSVCSGIGTSLIFMPAMTSPMTYFKKRRALAGGLTVAGSSLGGVVFPLMVNHLLPKIHFAWTMRICSFLILGLWAISVLTISSTLPHGRRPFKFVNYLRPFREPNFAILLGFCFFLYWGLFVTFNYLVFLGRTVPNAIADKYGRFNVLIVMLLFTGILTLALWLPGRSNAAIIVFATLFGISSGSCIGLSPPLLITIYPPKEIGFRMGAALMIGSIGALTSPPIAGAIAGVSGGSGASFIISTAFLVLARGRIDPLTIA